MCNGVPEGKAYYESCEPRESEKRASTNGLRSTNFLPFFSSFPIPLNIKKRKNTGTVHYILRDHIPDLIVDSQPTFVPTVTIIKLQKITKISYGPKF